MVSTTACTEAISRVYPQDAKSDSTREASTPKLIKENPETLFSDPFLTFVEPRNLETQNQIGRWPRHCHDNSQYLQEYYGTREPPAIWALFSPYKGKGPKRRSLPRLSTHTPNRHRQHLPLAVLLLLAPWKWPPPPTDQHHPSPLQNQHSRERSRAPSSL